MSDDSPFEWLHRHPSLFRQRHGDAHRLSAEGNQQRPAPTRVFGAIPGIKHPMLALSAIQQEGPARHALSQRVVAGMMDVRIVPILPAKKVDSPKKG